MTTIELSAIPNPKPEKSANLRSGERNFSNLEKTKLVPQIKTTAPANPLANLVKHMRLKLSVVAVRAVLRIEIIQAVINEDFRL